MKFLPSAVYLVLEADTLKNHFKTCSEGALNFHLKSINALLTNSSNNFSQKEREKLLDQLQFIQSLIQNENK